MGLTALSTASELRTFAELRERAREAGPKRVGVVLADDEVALAAMADAFRTGLAFPVLIGNEQHIRAKAESLGFSDLVAKAEFVHSEEGAAVHAVKMAREGSIDILMKGHLRTDQLMRPVLDKEHGLRNGRLLCDVAFFETKHTGKAKLLGLTDGGINVAPNLEQKKQIVLNAIDLMHCMGLHHPRIAVMSAVEVVTEAMPSTVDAHALTQMGLAGEFGEADVFGPLALDNALLHYAAKAKEISSGVAGNADCLIMPNVEAGNLLGKALFVLAGLESGHVVVGARVPILIPSRAEDANTKVNTISLGVLYANGLGAKGMTAAE
jgi:phosphate butyryltransferase